MPELPEVETIRRQLDQSLKGLKVTGIQILSKKNFIGLPGAVIGRKVEDVQRRAKIILIKLDGDKCLAIHLKLTGQLIYRCLGEKCLIILEKEEGPFSVKELPNKFTRIIIEFDKGKLYFNDLRKFGWIKVVDLKKGECDLPELKKLGPEAIEGKAFTRQYFQEVLLKSKKPIKLVILDQEKLAGVGNIYANEALFGAGISPTRPANSLKPVEADRLRETIIEVLRQAIAYQGTSDEDEAYRQTTGEKGRFQDFLKVYQKHDQKCPQCKGEIKRIKLGGRGTFYCPGCQK